MPSYNTQKKNVFLLYPSQNVRIKNIKKNFFSQKKQKSMEVLQ